MKLIYNKIDKQAVQNMLVEQFDGRIIVVQSESEAEKAVDYLLAQPILGIDTETRPSFRKGQTNQVALLQVATHDTCFLFRLNMIGITPSLVRLLEDKTIPKIGLSLKDDFGAMHKRTPFEQGYFIDLQTFVQQFGIQDMSLQKIYGNLFNMKISKTQRLSNWEAPVLTDKQKQYASIDAWACIRIYEKLQEMHKTNDYKLIEVEAAADTDVMSHNEGLYNYR